MIASRLRTTAEFAGTVAGAILLAPLAVAIIAIGLSGYLAGIVAAAAFVLFAMMIGPARAIEQSLIRAKIRSLSEAEGETRRLAGELGAPMVTRVRAPDRPLEVLIRNTDGTCPLMRHRGDAWLIDTSGNLSAPLCSPSAAAVQKLLQIDGLTSGSTEHCVCPFGDQSVTVALRAA